MTEREEVVRKMRAGKFKENTGKVMRTINILRTEYIPLKDIKYALPTITEGEIVDCINFLQEENYIRLRSIEFKTEIMLSDAHYTTLEAKATGKGIRLLGGGIHDDMIDM